MRAEAGFRDLPPWVHMSKLCSLMETFPVFVVIEVRELGVLEFKMQHFCISRELSGHPAQMLHFTGEEIETSRVKWPAFDTEFVSTQD